MSYTRNMTWISERKVMRRKRPYELSSFVYWCNFLCYMEFWLQNSIKYFIRRPRKTHSQFKKHFYSEKWAQSIEHWPLFAEYESKPEKSSLFDRTKSKITPKNLVLPKKNWNFIESKGMKFAAWNTLWWNTLTAQYWLCVSVNSQNIPLWLI